MIEDDSGQEHLSMSLTNRGLSLTLPVFDLSEGTCLAFLYSVLEPGNEMVFLSLDRTSLTSAVYRRSPENGIRFLSLFTTRKKLTMRTLYVRLEPIQSTRNLRRVRDSPQQPMGTLYLKIDRSHIELVSRKTPDGHQITFSSTRPQDSCFDFPVVDLSTVVVLELRYGETIQFFAVFGLRNDAIPWCDAKTQAQLGEEDFQPTTNETSSTWEDKALRWLGNRNYQEGLEAMSDRVEVELVPDLWLKIAAKRRRSVQLLQSGSNWPERREFSLGISISGRRGFGQSFSQKLGNLSDQWLA